VAASNIYESPRLLEEYLLFHYGSASDVFAGADADYPPALHEALGFPRRTVTHFSQSLVERGLDLGCAVGASTFAMSEHCEEVIGIDYSHAFIDAATRLQQGESIRYRRHDEAQRYEELIATASSRLERCRFQQGDAMQLSDALGQFDRVHAANLLCRLPRPVVLLEKLRHLVRSGGELVLATPCTWMEEFTAPEHWPKTNTLAWLREHLAPHFCLEHHGHEPFLLRETARKFQWSLSMVTRWRRL
jgi:SAM-dependent methyltransferase